MGILARLTGRSTAPPAKKTAERPDTKRSFRSVQVIADDPGCCDAARSLSGRRFLAEDAPMLPHGDCDAKECRCTYKRFNDRRTEPRRTADVQFDIAGQVRNDDRRNSASAGRRSED